MGNLFKPIIRTAAFFQKEIAEVARQPRLIITLALGPFLILLVFGIGYNNQPRAVRTLFVAPAGSPMAEEIQKEAPHISAQLIFMGIDPNQQEALKKLANGQVELVLVAPENVYHTIRDNQQAVFQLYHSEIDPAQASYDEYLGQIVIDEINRRILKSVIAQRQNQSGDLEQQINQARTNTHTMRQALQAGDLQTAQQSRQKLNANIGLIVQLAGDSVILFPEAQKGAGTSSIDPENQDTLTLLHNLKSDNNPQNLQNNHTAINNEIARVDKTDHELASLQARISEFKKISPSVLVQPFSIKSHSVTPIVPTPVEFFTPAVIVLLLQHIAVTISSLSIVRENTSGTMELFRVSPVTSGETIVGKYVSYMVFGVILAALLVVLVVYGLKIPMLGNWGGFTLVVLTVLFASLGYGFVISLVAETESQAVQLSMITLLLSVFFSGFLLDLRYFWPSVRILSYFIPATQGVALLKDVMLRGGTPNPVLMGELVLMGGILFMLAWLLLRRRMARR